MVRPSPYIIYVGSVAAKLFDRVLEKHYHGTLLEGKPRQQRRLKSYLYRIELKMERGRLARRMSGYREAQTIYDDVTKSI